jgi:hypothetical protein
MKIARKFTGGNAQHQTPTASRRDARAYRTAAETWSKARPTQDCGTQLWLFGCQHLQFPCEMPALPRRIPRPTNAYLDRK